MVLVDTSIWIRFLSGRQPYASHLDALLERGEVLAHDVVEGELLIGDRGGRPALLRDYRLPARATSIAHSELVAFATERGLHGRGIGWLDAHLLASAIVDGVPLWTADTGLATLAEEHRVSYT